MRAMESAGYDEMLDPPGLQLTLYPFQRQSLQWMFDRETAPGGLNALFWREYPGARGGGVDHTFWYNPMAGELRDAPLPIVSGGFLCEEMGLGKTVEMCALVLANPYTPHASAAGRARPRRGGYERRTTRSTLVVCPQVLLGQWQAEITKSTGARLTVHVHHGEAASRKPAPDLAPLETADVVLTTYEMLQRESAWPPRDRALLRMHWWRLVLDESQRMPKPANTKGAVMSGIAKARAELGPYLPCISLYLPYISPISPYISPTSPPISPKACEELGRTHTWCMSGTPVSSVVDDLLGQLIVLGVEPYCSRGDNGDAFWEREVRGRWNAKKPEGLEVVHDLLGQIMMRRWSAPWSGAS